MATSDGPSIIKNGLVLCLDAADKNSYPGSGTVWFDLSGNNNNGVLDDSVYVSVNGGVIECVDNSNLGSRINFGSLNLNTPSVSIEYWFKMTSNPNVSGDNEFRFMAFKTNNFFNYMEQSRVINFTVVKGGTQFRRIGDTGDGVFAHGINVAGSPFVIGDWYHCVFIYNQDDGRGSYYCNGNFIRTGLMRTQNSPFTAITPGPIDSSNTSFIFSRYNDPIRRFFPGYLASLKIYNKPLSAQEVKQNYNVMKSRYGL
jgi:hypothetical protein